MSSYLEEADFETIKPLRRPRRNITLPAVKTLKEKYSGGHLYEP